MAIPSTLGDMNYGRINPLSGIKAETPSSDTSGELVSREGLRAKAALALSAQKTTMPPTAQEISILRAFILTHPEKLDEINQAIKEATPGQIALAQKAGVHEPQLSIENGQVFVSYRDDNGLMESESLTGGETAFLPMSAWLSVGIAIGAYLVFDSYFHGGTTVDELIYTDDDDIEATETIRLVDGGLDKDNASGVTISAEKLLSVLEHFNKNGAVRTKDINNDLLVDVLRSHAITVRKEPDYNGNRLDDTGLLVLEKLRAASKYW